MEQGLYGREITRKEWKEDGAILEKADQRAGLLKVSGKWQCQRCGTDEADRFVPAPCACGKDCVYCSVCLNMGKIKTCSVLYSLPEQNTFDCPIGSPLQWNGTLSTEQNRASKDIVETVQQKTL
ncbi:hypothetical protein [Jeotgalibaca caeni]|uniref:hypothetical protein n=1 Tax=Jeotgalibaca caeni TaxID=3028623 RepID=UPI00237DEE90|nr:hypothetical protein [Jeotgalibaca caeni]MDE1549725.1 hypothetical protein [Jeotgalibaca caeni]